MLTNAQETRDLVSFARVMYSKPKEDDVCVSVCECAHISLEKDW